MEIRALHASEQEEAKRIWNVCFGDSPYFIDYYFDQMVDYGKTLGYYEDGALLSDLYMLPFHAKLAGSEYDADFLAGCATLPQARKRGLMRELVKTAMEQMLREGKCITYLHPFLHAFYRQFGYETVAYVTRKEFVPGNRGADDGGLRVIASLHDAPIELMHRSYQRYMDQFDNAFLRSRERFASWLGLLFADRGYAAVLKAGDRCAYALYYLEEGVADVFELVFWGEEQLGDLLQNIPAQRIRYFLPSSIEEDGAEEFTMMRVLDPASLLRRAKLTEKHFVIRIRDDFLEREWNFEVRKGSGENDVRTKEASADIDVTIAQFSALAAGSANGKGSTLFQKQTACFFETY